MYGVWLVNSALMILYLVFDMVLSTVRRWRNGKAVEVLEGHDGPVQAVLLLPSGEVVTGSSDTTMKFWRGSSCTNTIRGHTG